MPSEYVNADGSTGKQPVVNKVYGVEELKQYDDLKGSFKLNGEKGFYTHGTHKSMQKWEDGVKVSGDGFSDSSVPKTPKTDCFYDNVSNWAR